MLSANELEHARAGRKTKPFHWYSHPSYSTGLAKGFGVSSLDRSVSTLAIAYDWLEVVQVVVGRVASDAEF